LCIQSLQPNGLWFLGLIINFDERKVEIKRKARDFDVELCIQGGGISH
jgi:hypothetical protein